MSAIFSALWLFFWLPVGIPVYFGSTLAEKDSVEKGVSGVLAALNCLAVWYLFFHFLVKV